MGKPVLTKTDIAQLLSISVRKLEKMIAEGKFIQPALIGDLPRWRASDVMAWIEKWLAPGCRV